jgi:hypothetical protein
LIDPKYTKKRCRLIYIKEAQVLHKGCSASFEVDLSFNYPTLSNGVYLLKAFILSYYDYVQVKSNRLEKHFVVTDTSDVLMKPKSDVEKYDTSLQMELDPAILNMLVFQTESKDEQSDSDDSENEDDCQDSDD